MGMPNANAKCQLAIGICHWPFAKCQMPNAKSRNGRKSPKSGRQTKNRNKPNFGVRPTKSEHWIYGHHTVLAALNNPHRNVRRVLITAQAEAKLCCQIEPTLLEFVTTKEIEQLTGLNAVHQGIAAEVHHRPGLEQRWTGGHHQHHGPDGCRPDQSSGRRLPGQCLRQSR